MLDANMMSQQINVQAVNESWVEGVEIGGDLTQRHLITQWALFVSTTAALV